MYLVVLRVPKNIQAHQFIFKNFKHQNSSFRVTFQLNYMMQYRVTVDLQEHTVAALSAPTTVTLRLDTKEMNLELQIASISDSHLLFTIPTNPLSDQGLASQQVADFTLQEARPG